jgi:hypothetical protein
VISFDTNQVRGKSPDGALLRMLRKVAEETGHDLVLSEMVVEEYLAHYRHEIDVAVKKVGDGIDHLRQLVPSLPGQMPSFDSVGEMAESSRRAQLAQIFQTYRTPDGAWQEALFREARRRPPAKTSWETSGSGARDVAIWLTIVDACRHSGAETYFVTKNSGDFGKDGSLRPELAQDLDERLGPNAHLFRYCTDIPDLMSHLGIEQVQAPDDDSIGSAAPVRTAIERLLADEADVFFEIVQSIPDLAAKFVYVRDGVQNLLFERLQDKVEAYRIGEGVWACARGKWAAGKDLSVAWKPEFVPSAQVRNVRVNFMVTATVVMQLDGNGAIVAADVTDRSRLVITDEQA